MNRFFILAMVIYDFQYLEFLRRKYKFDEEWLNTEANFYFDKAIAIASAITSLHHTKLQKINLLGLRERKAKIIKKLKRDKKISKKHFDENVEKVFITAEFYQFHPLFETEKHLADGLNPLEIGESGWKSFYNGIIDLFCIRESDFSPELDIAAFLAKFAVTTTDEKDRNFQFQNIGDFNLLSARPIIPIDAARFFVPVGYSVYEAIYESPYYWMLDDKDYLDQLSIHRGNAGEEIAYELLKKVFGERRVFKSVRIESKKGHDDTDIDVLCILGSKALCVQVKSKKLTQLSRKGDSKQLKQDFKGAVQDAYKQGLVCRERIIERKATFYDENGDEIKIKDEIDDAYILIVTTENYPSLTHQSIILLEKQEADPHALVLTIFDLDLVLFYLNNPYDFLYYVRQRVALMDYYLANEEMSYLGYHLIEKLWKIQGAGYVNIDNYYARLIDRNYYPYKAGIETKSKTDKIGNRWKNDIFEELCQQIDDLKSPKATDIVFQLMDWSQDSRDNLTNQIESARAKTQADHKLHNVSIMAGPTRSPFGVTYVSWNNNNRDELTQSLYRLSEARKYRSKADAWVGIGCLMDTERLVDVTVYSDEKWKYDEELEHEVKVRLDGENRATQIRFGKKVGRNEDCPCGSGKKFKKCCGG